MVKREFFFDFSLREQTHRVALFTTIRAFYFHEYIFPENVSLVANTYYYLVNVYTSTVWLFLKTAAMCNFQCVQRCSRNACSTHSRGLPIFGSIIQICRFWSVDFERAGSSRELMAVASL